MQPNKTSQEYLDSFVNYEKTGFTGLKNNFDLGKLTEVLVFLGDPQKTYMSVHVAGTKGKGSVCAFTSSILREAGFKVGLFTSPHLSFERERIQINGEEISEEDLADALNILKENLPGDAQKTFSFFEVYTLLAILYFHMKNVDFAIFEVGLGGRLDATNVIDSEVSAITPVSFDHMHVLGSTLAGIAAEKAAIIKKGSVCVSSPQREEALEVIKEKCARVGASLMLVGEDIAYKVAGLTEEGSWFDAEGLKEKYSGCRTGLAGKFQVPNACTAIGICENLLHGEDIAIPIKKGIEKAFIPGRLEIIAKNPSIVIDGAQNAESARELKYSVEEIFKYDKLILLIGLSEDKDIKGFCGHLAPIADEVILTRSASKRAQSPEIIRGFVKGKPARITETAKEALGLALQASGKNDLVLAAGSFYLIGEVRDLVLNRK
ncbi:bifunctional folylpolyglutamate synthase/dihydrofolate synthase [Candidatus Omnitrophota bacterium]